MKMKVKFDYVALDAVHAHLMDEVDKLIAKKPQALTLKYLKAMDKQQIIAALKAAAQSMASSDMAYNTYQKAADAMMDVNHSALKDANLAEMNMDDYWAVIAESDDMEKALKAEAIEDAVSKAMKPYVAAAAQMLLTLTHSKQIVKVMEYVLTESPYKPDEYDYLKEFKFLVVDDSLMDQVVASDPNNDLMMLSAEPFSDYDENGFNADNESIYL
jgi:hypothetical protein